jgi:Lar family restriction alleviation protein
MSKDLKPCPFCGGEVEAKMGLGDIACITCDLCGAVVSFRGGELLKETISTWNRRADDEQS